MIGDFLRTDGSSLERFTRDLTADARASRLEPVRCREAEVDRVIDILLRQGKNNPTLVGPAGVGKTAIAEGLAQRIAAGRVPLALRDVRLLSLDHVALLAGTTYRGQYEERIRTLVAETTAARDVILFIDELHNLIGQGTAIGAAMDAANMLKPSLVRGDFRVIGATTRDEYDRWIGGDPALERRFQQVEVRELGPVEAFEILVARKERLERHHNVLIADEALRAAIELTDRYVTNRLRPDKAIDALDEACAHLQAVAEYSPRAEQLLKQRAALLRRPGAQRAAAAPAAGRPASGSADEGGMDEPPTAGPDPVERFAQDSFVALERIGAEIEALFTGAPPRRPEGDPTRGGPSPSASPSAAPAGSVIPTALAVLETELQRLLMEAGIVVRGHDVARVVGLMANTEVAWQG